jgi:hypothetical protein
MPARVSCNDGAPTDRCSTRPAMTCQRYADEQRHPRNIFLFAQAPRCRRWFRLRAGHQRVSSRVITASATVSAAAASVCAVCTSRCGRQRACAPSVARAGGTTIRFFAASQRPDCCRDILTARAPPEILRDGAAERAHGVCGGGGGRCAARRGALARAEACARAGAVHRQEFWHRVSHRVKRGAQRPCETTVLKPVRVKRGA